LKEDDERLILKDAFEIPSCRSTKFPLFQHLQIVIIAVIGARYTPHNNSRAHKAMSSNDFNFKLAYMTSRLINLLTVSKFTITRQSTPVPLLKPH